MIEYSVRGSARPRVRSDSGATRLSVVVVVAVILFAIVVMLLTAKRTSQTAVRPGNEKPDVAAEAASSQLAASPPQDVREVVGQPSEVEQVSNTQMTAAASAEVRGRFVLSSGEPVAGVSLHMTTRLVEGDYSLHAQTWADKQAASDADGRFSITFDPPARLAVVLDATPVGLCPVQWSWTDLRRRDNLDLGDIQLQPGATIAGALLDEQRNPLRGRDWVVRALRGGTPDFFPGQQPLEMQCDSNPLTGGFQLDNVPPGHVLVRAEHGGAYRFDGPTLDLHPQEHVVVELICPEAAITSRISVILTCPPFGSVIRNVPAVTAIGGGMVVKADRPRLKTQCFTFDNLPHGSYSIRVDDPLFLPWSRDGVVRGAVVRAQLKGSAGVQLTVIDSANGNPVASYSVKCQMQDETWGNMLVPVANAGEPATVPGSYQASCPSIRL